MKAKLTHRTIAALKASPDKDLLCYDTEFVGFGVRVTRAGAKSFIVQYRTEGGRVRRLTIAPVGAMTPDEARDVARDAIADARRGGDPMQQKQDARSAPTVVELCRRYLDEYAAARKKPTSLRNDRQLIRDHIVPRLGTRKVAEVSRLDVTRLHSDLHTTPYQANRVLALISKLFNLAEKWGLRPDGTNPVRHVERFKEAKRRRYLSGPELARLGTVLAELDRESSGNRFAVAAIRLLLLSGCRLGEILGATWEAIDFDRGILTLRDSKTGAREVVLSSAALAVVNSLPRVPHNPYLIPGKMPGGHLVGLPHIWQRVRRRADLEDVRIHDLRHTAASISVSAGESLPIVGALLGHRRTETTARCAHLQLDPVRAAAERLGTALSAALGSRPSESANAGVLKSR